MSSDSGTPQHSLSPEEDDGLFTPDTDHAPSIEALPSTESLDSCSTGRGLASVKSIENMESIYLEAEGPASADEGPDLVLDSNPNQTASASLDLGFQGGGSSNLTSADFFSDALDISMEPRTNNDISKYFAGPSAIIEQESAKDFFDTLAAEQISLDDSAHPQQNLGWDVSETDGQDDPNSQFNIIRRHRSTSSTEDAQPVAFAEDKGEGMLKATQSTRSLTKFFTEDISTPATDPEGKSFFDTFTVSGSSDLSQTTSPQETTPDLLQQQLSPSGIPPATHPIHLPGASPMPSPFHSIPIPAPTPSDTPVHISPNPDPILNSSTNSSMAPTPDILSLGTSPSLMTEDMKATSVPFLDGEDPFTASLNMSDLERRNDAWIPSEATRLALVARLSSPSVFPQPDQVTMPGIILDEPQGDPVQDLVRRFIGEEEASKRTTLSANSVAQDETGLRELIKSECWRAAVDLTCKLLTQCGQGAAKLHQPSRHTPYTLQLWLTRISLLMKLRLYSAADAELQAFHTLDGPDLYFDFYPDKYPGRRGTMVPFALRVLHAELPQYLGKTQDALDRLYYLLAIVEKILSNLASGLAEDGSMLALSDHSRKASREMWGQREAQLLYSIGNCLIIIKDYASAVDVYQQLLKRDTNNSARLLCGMARLYLQMGDLRTAQRYFNQSEGRMDLNLPQDKCSSLMNKGFMALGQNQFQEAHQLFKQAIQICPTNAVATNNMAVCLLYMGKLKEALVCLEDLVNSDPARFLQEGVLFNLCTLYELESSHAMQRKQLLLGLVSQHKGNGFNTACLKMT